MKEMFFWNSLDFFCEPTDLAIWSLVPLPFLYPACASGNSRIMCCWNLAWRILSITLLACEMQLCSSLNILWHCHSLGLEWKLRFSSSVATADFSKFACILSAALSQHHLSGPPESRNPITSTNFAHSNASWVTLDFTLQRVWLQMSDHITHLFIETFINGYPVSLKHFFFVILFTETFFYTVLLGSLATSS